MTAWIAVAALWMGGTARAEPGDEPYVGLPLAALGPIGLGLPTRSEPDAHGPVTQRYPVDGGGFAIVVVARTDADADAVFARLAESGATHWPAAARPLAGDRALGDGAAVVLVRSGNAVVLVRDPNDRADDVRARIVAALVRTEAACAGHGAIADGQASDGCGRAR